MLTGLVSLPPSLVQDRASVSLGSEPPSLKPAASRHLVGKPQLSANARKCSAFYPILSDWAVLGGVRPDLLVESSHSYTQRV
jgi:hypothetical protein